jgi:hypothetical protein
MSLHIYKGNLRTRSRLTLTDLETMIGTLVNEEQIKGRSQVLDRDVNVVQLGRFKHLFRHVSSKSIDTSI